MNNQTVIYPARIVRTMDPSRPVATAFAVRDGLIRAVGTVEELGVYPNTVIDERYADTVIVPGFVEAHAHAGSGGMWDGQVYVGYFDRTDPDGNLWPGCTSTGAILERLREAEAALADPLEPLRAWGMDNIYFPESSILVRELDTVSATRPIQVNHANGHVAVVNSAVLRMAGIDAATATEGVEKYADGTPNGELREFAAMGLVHELFGGGLLSLSPRTLSNFAQDAVNQGVTTITDLGSMGLLTEEGRATYADTVDEDFPVRLNVFQFGMGLGTGSLPEATAEALAAVKQLGHSKLRFGNVKLMLDGSIQGFTARLLAPGYLGDQPNGIWNTTPEEFEAAFTAFHRAGAADPRALQRRPGQRALPGHSRIGAHQVPAAGPPAHHDPLPAHHPGAVPPRRRAGRLRQHLLQPPLVLGRPARRQDPGLGPRLADGRDPLRAQRRGADLAALRHPGHRAQPAENDEARHHPADPLGTDPGRTRTPHGGRSAPRGHPGRGLHAEDGRRGRLPRSRKAGGCGDSGPRPLRNGAGGDRRDPRAGHHARRPPPRRQARRPGIGGLMPVPLTIVGGYLGAGKTTLINDLLAQTGQRIAVVVNDFGEVNIDAKLIRSADGDTIELVNGCICCSLSDGLGELLPRLARRDDLDAVVVEVSGVGEPGKLASWMGYPGFSAGGVLVCADAGALGRLAGDRYVGDTVTAQLKVADLVLLTKGDAASPAQSAAARQVLEETNPGVAVLPTRRGPGRWEEINVALAGVLESRRGIGGGGSRSHRGGARIRSCPRPRRCTAAPGCTAAHRSTARGW